LQAGCHWNGILITDYICVYCIQTQNISQGT
jgi:hypothetical protein